MENNSFLIKTIAGALILILALNVYRTESTKKQMDRLTSTVDSLSVRMDALEYPDFSDIASGAVQNVVNKAVADLAKGLTQLQAKVTTLQGKVDNISSNPSSGSKESAAKAGSGKDVSDLAKSVSDLQSKVNALQKAVDRLSGGQRQASSNPGSSAATAVQPSSGGKTIATFTNRTGAAVYHPFEGYGVVAWSFPLELLSSKEELNEIIDKSLKLF